MTDWRGRITLNTITERLTDANAAEMGVRIAEQIERQMKRRLEPDNPDFDHDLDDALQMLKNVTGFESEGDIITPKQELEIRLDELYDWADRNAVWVVPGWAQWR